MDRDQIRALIEGGENLSIEYKSDLGPLSDEDLIDTVVCLANGQGGLLLIGIEDDGRVTGLHPRHQTSADQLSALVASRTVPPLSIEATFQKVNTSDEELTIAILQITPSVYPVATSDGRMRIRYLDSLGRPGCRPLYPNELQSWQSDRGQIDVTTQPITSATWDDLDLLEFARLRRIFEEYRGDNTLMDLSDHELARALGLTVNADGNWRPTLAGLLLVGREAALMNHIPSHEVAFQVLENGEVLVNEFYRWPLLRVFDRVLEAFQVRNEEREINVGLFRVGVPAYDPRGFRESLNNALVHRDYRRLGAVHVQLHSDRIIINNPGGFIEGVRPDNLLVIGPRPRNPRLADCFKRIGLVERTGRGVNIIYSGQLRNGRPPPSYAATTEVSVSLTLYGGPADLDFVQLVIAEENRLQRQITVGELLILDHVRREREIDTVAASALIQNPETETRAMLEALVESGLLERRGSGRSRTYLLSAGVYRDLGQPAAYVRTRGFERPQMEQMIHQYVQAHSRITRREVVELCRVSETQASYLLKTLVEKDVLKLVGLGRNAHYTIGENG